MHSERSVSPGFIAVAVVLTLLPSSGAQTRNSVARIGTQAIDEEDLVPFTEGRLLQLRNEEYELKRRALDQLINQRLLEAEARDKGITVEALLEQVDKDAPPWHSKELEGFYLARRDVFQKPLEAVRPEVEKAFLQARREQDRQEFVDQLRKKAGVVILLNRPIPVLAADPGRIRGDVSAPVTITEFGDFQCPYCQSVQPVLNQVLEKYRGKVRLSFRDFPLRSIHPQAQPAAEAARCASEQGRFWQYADLLFANQSGLNPSAYRQFAISAGLDPRQFESCFGSGRFKPLIDSDFQTAEACGVGATPTFVIGGVVLSGWQPLAAFEKAIEEQLSALRSRTPAP